MSMNSRKRSHKIGLPPGTLIHVGEKKVEETLIELIRYNEDNADIKQLKSVEACFPVKDESSVTWINIDGLHDISHVETIGKHFNIHPLVLEDILQTEQRPKTEDFDDYLFIVLRMLWYDDKKEDIREEQLSIILGSNFILSFQEILGDVFDSIRERIRQGKLRIRKSKADYLAYSLVDSVVDHYFIILEKVGEKLESLEDELLMDPTPRTLTSIYDLKRKLILLRKSVWPLREVLHNLQTSESPLIHEATNIFFRDVYDHTIQIMDTIETYRDMVAGMLDMYLSSVSYRMNEIMKVLTMIATVFIPLTFIAGVYGMNFLHMPELHWRWGYPLLWLIMIIITLGMIYSFRRKKWL